MGELIKNADFTPGLLDEKHILTKFLICMHTEGWDALLI